MPKNACNVGVLSEVDLLLPEYRTRVQMIRQYHRMVCMDDSRLTKRVYLWDKALNDREIVSTWSSEIKNIFQDCNLDLLYTVNCPFELKFIVSNVTSKFKQKQSEYLKTACSEKPKLRTFVLFKIFDETPSFILKSLSFHERRMMSKLRLGCLPIRIETGRYSIPRVPEDQRTCLVCKFDLETTNPLLDKIESEIHYLFACQVYSTERDEWFSKMTLPVDFDHLTLQQKLNIVLNDPCNVKLTAKFIKIAFDLRNKILN